MAKVNVSQLKDISETLLIPLYSRALLTKGKRPPISDSDTDTVTIVDEIDYDFTRFKTSKGTLAGIACRTCILDNIVKEWLVNRPGDIVIKIGVGIDTRALRFPQSQWYNIDLPEAIQVREKLLTTNETNIAQSAFDFSRMDKIPEKENILIFSEAAMIFFSSGDINTLLLCALDSIFRNSLFVFKTVLRLAVKNIKINGNPLKCSDEDLNDIVRPNLQFQVIGGYMFINYFKKSEIYFSDCLLN
ncbi:MAG: class I SAM-dependent methyltransferase [Prevotellaceae bacterium]|jgi:O-methyltransferase involved in polyketide biosynthesis|nr:class I SAM-dependent methyltransferase [Prevotellaceae bacterium]